MASTTQIVPKFQHPHVYTVINDNTQYVDTPETPIDRSYKFIAVFRSGKGVANKLVKMQDLNSFINHFGKSNYAKYGQPLMMPIAELSSGNANVWCMRIMPEDAAIANSVLTAYYKVDTDNKKFQVKFKESHFDGILTKEALEAKASVNTEEADTLDGWTPVPLAYFMSTGSGICGNAYRWRITKNLDWEKDYSKKIYSFEVLTTESGITKEDTFNGSVVTFDDEEEALLINDIILEKEDGTYHVAINVFEEGVETIYDAYKEFLSTLATDDAVEVEVPDLYQFDLFFGHKLGSSTETYDHYEVVSSETDATCIDVDTAVGVVLAGGTDGAFDTENAAAAEEELYIKAFSGELDKLILSSKRIPASVLLDANYPYEVKKVLAQLAIAREDALLYLDCGLDITSFSTDVLRNLKNNYADVFNHRTISKNPQHYITKDPHTKKKVPVTMTYFIAENIVEHFDENGIQVPFVKAYAQLSNHVRNSLAPSVEVFESELKEVLYENRFNYFESIGENVFQRSVQNTAQMINSDLLEESNMHVLYELKRIVENDAFLNTYNFTSKDDRARFQQKEEAKFANWVGSKLQSFAIRFDVNDWEGERSILHCYIDIQFRNITKRTIIEIDVNKRDFTA